MADSKVVTDNNIQNDILKKEPAAAEDEIVTKIPLSNVDRIISVNYVIRQKNGKTLDDSVKNIDLTKLSTEYELMPLCITGIEDPKKISDLKIAEEKYQTITFVPKGITGVIDDGDIGNIFKLGGVNKRKNTPFKKTRKNTRRNRR